MPSACLPVGVGSPHSLLTSGPYLTSGVLEFERFGLRVCAGYSVSIKFFVSSNILNLSVLFYSWTFKCLISQTRFSLLSLKYSSSPGVKLSLRVPPFLFGCCLLY